MRLGTTQELRLQQKLIMTQELRQSIQILQYSTLELVEFLSIQTEINPILEIESFGKSIEFEIVNPCEDLHHKEDYDNYAYTPYDPNKDEFDYERFTSYNNTLYDFLYEQLYMSHLNKGEQSIISYLIENINSNGYLNPEFEIELKEYGWNDEEIENCVKILQTFEPLGIGARNLSECLEIQLKSMENIPDYAIEIVRNNLVELSNNRLDLISKAYKISTNKVQAIYDLIKKLDPKPGSAFRSDRNSIKYIVPDVYLRKIDGGFEIDLNSEILPKLKYNETYIKIIESDTDEKAKEFLENKYKSAENILKGIEQRENTILRITNAILDYQRDYFYENKPLKPMTLKDIANMTDLHESTISRGVNHKYIQTDSGIMELKCYFTSALQGSKGEVSSNEIKKRIEQMIKNEDPKKPLSDQKIAEALNQSGVEISRRTIAKYRDELNILSSSKRRRY
ncbi:MAG: RNA polymerase factor sigma-54 [Tissierellia bacterium]|nr:RNA polymerase factor sigma-54 [Tissierellia bacterium]